MSDTKSLDDTLKELLESTPEVKPEVEEKPRRRRRTKAEIEADNQLEKSKAKKADESKDNIKGKNNTTIDGSLESTTTENNSQNSNDIIITESTEISDDVDTNIFQPEIIPDTTKDSEPDVEELPIVEKSNNSIASSITSPSRLNKSSDSTSILNKSVVLEKITPMYRARHLSMKIRSYKGLVTFIEKPKDGFVRVQYLRPGFGLCESYMNIEDIPSSQKGDDSEET